MDTLTISKDLFEKAEQYALEQGQTLSHLVENYLKLLTSEEQKWADSSLAPRVKQLRGLIQLDETLDYKRVLAAERTKKYDS